MLVKPAMITSYWSLLNITSKQIQWVLDKATPDITLSKQSISLDSDNLTDTFIITTNNTGTLSISSSDNSIATVSLSGNTVTVTAVANGLTTITVNVAENSNYIAGAKTLSVDVQLVSTILNDNSWNTIKTTIQSGEAASLWKVGDTKEVILNGDTTNSSNETKSYNNYSCYATILGFDHNAGFETDGEHSVHFILGKDSMGKDICFYPYVMNDSATTNGGWNGSKMKQTTVVEFENCLPTNLRAVLKNVTKYTHNSIGGSNYNYAHYVTATTERVFLLSEFEVHGTRYYVNSYEKDKQAQYTYYANGNSKVRYRDIDGTAQHWWLRSAYCNYPAYEGQDGFCCVGSDGKAYDGLNIQYNYFANNSYGVALAFVV